MYSILIIDDEKNIADGVCFTAQEYFGDEVSVFACYGAESARKFIAQNVIDIVVCDINMPKQSGLSLCEELLKDYPDLKVIFLTGYSDFSYTYQALKLPDVSYVLKLENDQILLDEISKKMQLIEKRRQARLELLLEKAKNRALENQIGKLKLENALSLENSLEFSACSMIFAKFKGEIPQTERLDVCLNEIFGENYCLLTNEEGCVITLSITEHEGVVFEKIKRFQKSLFDLTSVYSLFVVSPPQTATDSARYLELLKGAKHFNVGDALYFYNVEEIKQINHDNEGTDAIIIEKVTEYIDKNLKEDLSLTVLAELVFYNPAYLSRKFKQVIGVNLKEYILNKRIELAKKLLLNNNLFIKDVATECGFSNATQFGIVFMKKTGVSPSAYRLQGQE